MSSIVTPLPDQEVDGLLARMKRARLVGPVDNARLLADVARDEEAPLADRVIATRGLGRLADQSEARAAALARAADPNVRVRRAAYAALAEAADRDDVAVLATMDEPVGSARPALAFAQAVAAHRAGVDQRFLPTARPSPRRPSARGRRQHVELVAAAPEDARRALAVFHGPTFGLSLAADVQRLRCGTTEWDLIGNAEPGGFAAPFDRLVERPWVLALVALRRPRAELTDTQYVVLTQPSPPVVEMQVVRTDGAVAYLGTIAAADGGWSFTVADADRPQTVPTALAGAVDHGRMALTSAAVAITRARRRTTRSSAPS